MIGTLHNRLNEIERKLQPDGFIVVRLPQGADLEKIMRESRQRGERSILIERSYGTPQLKIT